MQILILPWLMNGERMQSIYPCMLWAMRDYASYNDEYLEYYLRAAITVNESYSISFEAACLAEKF